jgi:uncharacterized protein YwqG
MKISNLEIELLKTYIEEFHLGEISELIIDKAQSCIGINVEKIKYEKNLKGISKFGGNPHLPLLFSWPKNELKNEKKGWITFEKSGNSETTYHEEDATPFFSFICQFNFKDFKNYDTENLLPEDGMLYFFYHEGEGYDNEENDFKLFYTDEKNLEIVEFPDQDYIKNISEELRTQKDQSYEMIFRKKIRLSNPYSLDSELDSENDEGFDKYFDNYEKMFKKLVEKEIVENGLMLLSCYNYQDIRYYDDYNEIYKETDYIPLFRIKSNNKIGYTWENDKSLVCWISKEDLINKNFNNAKFHIYEDS